PNEKPVEVAKATTQVAVVTPPAPTPAMVAAKLHFDWNTKGNGKLLPTRVFDDGSALFLAWSHDTPLPAILTMSEDRKEGPLNYRMDGDYIVIAPIPQNVVLRYGNKTAALWPSRRIAPAQSSAVAATSVAPPQASPVQQAPAPVAAPPPSAVRVANLTALYSDKLTDTAHDQ
ncbi:MAG: TrbG/VirB9 family P-type conjugative transfer protein, partial [Sphingomicrobium sp.]